MKVTICIPYFYGSMHLNDLLQSIVIQRHQYELDVLICNDSPGDEKINNIVREFVDIISVEVIENEKNIGPSKTLQYLYSNAKGDVLIHVDQDDYFIGENTLEKLVQNLINCDTVRSVFPSIQGPRADRLSDLVNTFYFGAEEIILKRVLVPHSGHTFWKKHLDVTKLSKFWIDLDKYRILIYARSAIKINTAFIYIRSNRNSLTSLLSRNLVQVHVRIIRNLIYVSKYNNIKYTIPEIFTHINSCIKILIKIYILNVHS